MPLLMGLVSLEASLLGVDSSLLTVSSRRFSCVHVRCLAVFLVCSPSMETRQIRAHFNDPFKLPHVC